MGTPNDVLRIAAGEIGYYAPDDPQPGSKYGRWMADVTGESWLAGPSTEVWWCMIFVSWVFAQAGVDTDQDGVVSNQDSRDMSAIGGVPSTAWQVGRGGSDVIAALQSKVGVEADRYFGPNTCRALQRYLGTEQDGVLSRPSACVREMQRRLNAGTF